MSAHPERDYDEPVLIVRVRDIIEDLRSDISGRLDDIDRKLDDRVTVGVFRALRSDLDGEIKRAKGAEEMLSASGKVTEMRVQALENKLRSYEDQGSGMAKVARFVGSLPAKVFGVLHLIVTTVLAVLYVWEKIHG